MDAVARLRALYDALPPGGSATLTRENLALWLGIATELPAMQGGRPEIQDDLTLPEVAARVDRSVSTVRTWCNSGLLQGAYRLRGKEWKVPVGALNAFLAAEAQQKERNEGPALGRGKPAKLDDWRKHVDPAA